MLQTKKRLLTLIFATALTVFTLGVSVAYSDYAHAEEWEPCTKEYTIMDILTETLFVGNESVQDESEYSAQTNPLVERGSANASHQTEQYNNLATPSHSQKKFINTVNY